MKIDNKSIKILIIDDEAPIRDVLSATLKDEYYQVQAAHDGQSGLQAIREFQPDVVFLDIWMPGSLDGIQVLTEAKKNFPEVEFVMISGHGTIETAVKATKLGAWDFIEKPLSMDKILIVITNIIQFQQEKIEKTLLLNKLRKSIALIGEAPAIVETKQMIAKIAPLQVPVLISGEDGVGKELVAQNLHYLSGRAGRSYIDFNCALVPEDLLEGEIFGIEKGVLPGIDKVKKGKLDHAIGGTLFIDEVTALTPIAQDKLLRFLLEKKFSRMGNTDAIQADVRVIVSSTKDIESEVVTGRFREDLFKQLNQAQIRIPSLREHVEDIPVLVSHFSDYFTRDGGYLHKSFSEQAMKKLLQYNWPGNVRELRNFIERVYILTPGEFVDVHDLRFAGLIDKSEEALVSMDELTTFRDARAKFEKEYLIRKIAENNGNISKTAEVIGLERSYLHRKIKSYGIDV